MLSVVVDVDIDVDIDVDVDVVVTSVATVVDKVERVEVCSVVEDAYASNVVPSFPDG